MALVQPRPVGKRCALRHASASGSPEAKPARAVFTTPSWTRGASCTGTTSPSPATTRTSTSWKS
eukprot:10876751-Alexandrium_andersonii.AAC.1